MRPSNIARALLFLVPLVFLAAFFFYPLARIFQTSFAQEQDGHIGTLLATPYIWRVLWFTTWQAAASTLLTLAIGLPLAFIFARYDFPGKTLLRALTTIPFVLPTVVVATAFTALLGPRGLLNVWLQNRLQLDAAPIQLGQTIWIILLAHAFYNFSVVVRTVGGFWANLGPRLEEAAATLGAGPWTRLREVTLPLLLPSIIASALLVFLFCFTSFGVILILGGYQFATLEVEIYRQAVSLFNLPQAAVLALLQMVCTFGIMAIYTRLQARASLPLDVMPAGATARRPRHRLELIAVVAAGGLMLLLLLSPLLALVWRSFTLGGGFTTEYYAELTINRRGSAFFVAPVVAIRNSLVFGVSAMLLSLVLGVITAYLLAQPRRLLTMILEPIFLLPLGTSAVTLGFGYIIGLGPLRTSLWLVPIAHTLIAAPFVVRTFLPALRRLDPRLRAAAAVLGARPARVWREIDVPLLLPALIVSATFAFTISLGEFGATLLISRPETPTMPVVIYRALGQPGLLNLGQALAMSTILMATTAVGLIAIERFRVPGTGEF